MDLDSVRFGRECIAGDDFFQEILLPLSLMYMNIQTLENGIRRKDVVSRSVTRIKENWFSLMKVLTDTMDDRKISEGLLCPVIANVDAAALVRRAAEQAKLLAWRRQIAILFNNDGKKFLTATDPHILERILLNLLNGALKRTEDGQSVCVSGRALPEGAYVVSVADRGADADLTTLQTTTGSPDAGARALGGGVSIRLVRHLAEMIDAQINVELSRDKTEVTLIVPEKPLVGAGGAPKAGDAFYSSNIYQIELS